MHTDTLYDVIIIGAGLSGLNCALELRKRGLSPLVLEAENAVGGRVRTDIVDGYRLDRGFQVLLTAYPEAERVLDYKALSLRKFKSGALIKTDSGFTRMADPFREPEAIFATLISSAAPLSDKLKVAYLRQKLMNMPLSEVFNQPEKTILESLTSYGFSKDIIEHFFKPFFGGITLDATLGGSTRMFDFVFKMMTVGDVAVPALGMGEISNQMAARLPGDSVVCNSKVQAVEYAGGDNVTMVTLSDGVRLKARAVVVATEASAAKRLIPGLTIPAFRATTCLYFACTGDVPDEAVLMLNGTDNGLINNVAPMSSVSPELAPPGKRLLSVSVLAESADQAAVAKELNAWFGGESEHIKTYNIVEALPDQSPPWLEPPRRPVAIGSEGQNLYVCGDHRDNASINGALVSGRRTAEQVSSDLKVTALSH